MNKICTSIEQSKKLLKLGIGISTADMIHNILGESYVRHDTPIDKYHTPAWSLNALLDLMPNVNGHYPELCRGKHTGQYYMWIEDTFDTQTFNNPIDAAFKMICWLKENGKI